jgi:hypothetical protein
MRRRFNVIVFSTVRWGLAALIVLNAGCTTVQQRYDNATHIAAHRSLDSRSLDGTYSLTVFRDDGFSLRRCLMGVYINNHKVAELNVGEKVQLLAPSKQFWLTVNSEGNRRCADENMAEKTIVLTEEKPVVIRITTFGYGNIDIQMLGLAEDSQ